MSEIVLRNVDPVLADRIRRVAESHGWSLQNALMHLLEHGLFACESELAARFSDTDADALQAAIAALEQVPSDPGFSMIGRAGAAAPEKPRPDQSIPAHLFDDHPLPDIPVGRPRNF